MLYSRERSFSLLGIFGEYLARMHFRSMDRPPYLVGETAALSEPDAIVTESVSLQFGRMELFNYIEEREA